MIFRRKINFVFIALLLLILLVSPISSIRKYSKKDVFRLREEVREMFQHAYNGYLNYAKDYDELRPLSCDGVNTWGSYSLTLIDALDTLAVMGNYTEFKRVVNLLSEKSNFDSDINVSVFETNIRIVGGLLSAHLLSHKAGVILEPGWPCNGPLLRLAEDVAKRLLPAFDTKTGMPYGTVNLKYGVPAGETSVTCTAGVGTFVVEFGTLSRLTGDPIYEEVALNALYALWEHRSAIGLFGNHIDVQTGRWTAQDSGIGAGIDSYYEYLVKGAILLNLPELLEMFHEGRRSVEKFLKRDDWYVWVSMNKGQVTLPVFQSLEAYWPGVLSLIGETMPAMRTIKNYHSVWKQYGFLPEFYNIPTAEASANRENYPLRPELVESAMYLYRATGDSYLLEIGEDMLRSVQYSARTHCGYATIKNVRDHRKEDRMESFFLAETTKYLYLLFDSDNFINNNGGRGTVIHTPNGMCIVDAGGYIFNTEAHPIDPSALRCCHDMVKQNLLGDFTVEKYRGDVLKINDITSDGYSCYKKRVPKPNGLTVDISAPIDPDITRKKIASEIINNMKLNEKNQNKSTKINSPIRAKVLQEEKQNTAQPMLSDTEKVKSIDTVLDLSPKDIVKNHLFEQRKLIDNQLKSFESNFSYIFKFLENPVIMRKEILDWIHAETTANKTLKYTYFQIIDIYKRYALIIAGLDLLEHLERLKRQTWLSSSESVIPTALKILNTLNNGQEVSITAESIEIYDAIIQAHDSYNLFMLQRELYVENYFNLLNVSNHNGNVNVLFNIISDMSKKLINRLKNSSQRDDNTRIEVYTYLEKYLRPITNIYEAIFELNFKYVNLIDEDSDIDTSTSTEAKENNNFEEKKNPNQNADIADDIIVAVTGKPNARNIGIGKGTVEPVNLSLDNSENTDKIEQVLQEKKIDQLPEDGSNNSILSDFVQAMLKPPMPTKPKFDSQLFLQKIRAKGLYMNKTQKFDLFSCRAQPFEQRLTRNSDFY